MGNTYIDVVTDLPLEEVRRRLREIVLEPGERQSQVHQAFKGYIDPKEARFTNRWSRTGTVAYELSFETADEQTQVRLSNNVYQKRSANDVLLKAIIAPFGVFLLIMGLASYNNPSQSFFTIVVSIIFLVISIRNKAKPLTKEEYLNNKDVGFIIETIKGRVV